MGVAACPAQKWMAAAAEQYVVTEEGGRVFVSVLPGQAVVLHVERSELRCCIMSGTSSQRVPHCSAALS